ncbi:MAG: ABC transporter permease [Terriglobia bacterium]|jgi:predicted permease
MSRRQRMMDNLDQDIRDYIERETQDNIERGMALEEARYAALRKFGNVTRIREEAREVWSFLWLEQLWQDVRYGGRTLARNPGFTAVAVLTLALGIGVNTAIFSLIDAVMLRMLPVEKPGELFQVQVGNADEGGGGSGGDSVFTTPMWEQLRDHEDVFSSTLAWAGTNFDLAEGGTTRALNGLWVSGSFFRVLGLHPAAGRLIADTDDRLGCPAVAVLSYGFWQERYGGAKKAIGSTLSLGSHPFEVIGVTPPGFFGLEVGGKFDVAAPICAKAIFGGEKPHLDNVQVFWLNVAGRINPKLSRAQCTTRLGILATRLFVAPNASPEERQALMKITLRIVPAGTGISGLRGPFSQPLQILMAVVGIVLLIACANLAGLTLARAAARRKEIAVRQALGASRTRLIRQLLTECVLLSSAGALLGILLARWTAALLLRTISTAKNTVFLDLSLNTRILGFVLATVALTSLLISLLPALRSTRVSLISAIKGSQSSEASRDWGLRGRQWIVGSQVALSLVLLVSAGLLLRSFVKLITLDIGFDRNNVLLVGTHLKPAKVPPERWMATYEEIENRLKALPGVLSVGRSEVTPISGALLEFGDVQSDWLKLSTSLRSPTRLEDPEAPAYANFISPGYVPTLRMPLLAGRNFTRADLETSSGVAVVNQTFSRRFFPHLNPIGRTFRMDLPPQKPFEVVGLIEDLKYYSLREGTQAIVLLPTNQLPAEPMVFGNHETIELRTAIPPSALVAPVRAAVAEVSSAIPLEFHTLAQQVNDSLIQERMLALLSGFFGVLALLLAMIGLYGTFSYLVTQRQREFGVRMALGAAPVAILGLVMRDIIAVLAGGMVAGVLISLAATRVLQQMLFGLGPRDATTMFLAAGVLTAVALLAGYLPARRAMKVEPMVALRYE